MSEEEKAIKDLVEYLRKKYNLKKYPEEIYKLCNECDQECHKFGINNELGIVYEQFNSKYFDILDEDLFHKASFLGYNTENGPKWFLVDPTYGQFFENQTFKDYILNNYPSFSKELLEKGYIEATLENLIVYIESFIVTYKKGNTKEIIDKYLNYLVNMKIIRKELTENYNKQNHR